uniref:EIF-5a domain-containing protein n=1 Tax=Macrostomum lignano TaxID=282301 RepID=A0A1I8FIF0_9PLAT
AAASAPEPAVSAAVPPTRDVSRVSPDDPDDDGDEDDDEEDAGVESRALQKKIRTIVSNGNGGIILIIQISELGDCIPKAWFKDSDLKKNKGNILKLEYIRDIQTQNGRLQERLDLAADPDDGDAECGIAGDDHLIRDLLCLLSSGGADQAAAGQQGLPDKSQPTVRCSGTPPLNRSQS